MTSDVLSLDEAVPLGYALVDSLAQRHGVRCLAIKGPILEAQGLRAPHRSIDVDVWAEPSGVNELASALSSLGWTERERTSTTAHILPEHARAFIHPQWPMEIDLHHRFPGFLAPADQVFDALWTRRTTVVTAAQPVTCLDIVGNAAVQGLHLLRSASLTADQVDALCKTLQNILTDSQVAELSILARETRASATLEPLLRCMGVGVSAESVDSDMLAWQLNASSGSVPVVAWLHKVVNSPWRERPALLRQAFLLTEPEMACLYPRLAGKPLGTWIARVVRLLRALTYAPRALVRIATTKRRS